jgi:hypothetical protein
MSASSPSTDYDTLTVGAQGTGNDMGDIAEILLYEDVDGDMMLSMPDIQLGAVGAGFPMDDGEVTFTLPMPVSLAAGQFVDYLIVIDMAGTASGQETFQVSLTDINITAPPGGMPAGVPRLGTLLTVQDPDLTVGLGPQSPAMPAGVIGQSDSVVAQLEFSAAGSAATVTGVRLDASGTGNDRTGIAVVRLVRENPSTTNGRRDPAEQVVATGIYSSDNATLNLTLAAPITVGIMQPVEVLVLYDYTMTAAAPGSPETYCITIDQAADIATTAAQVILTGGMINVCSTVRDSCPRTLCGDCDQNGAVNILDALIAAQDAAGSLMPPLSGSGFSNCNVTGPVEPDPSAQVNILDALVIAQLSAGLAPPHMCC